MEEARKLELEIIYEGKNITKDISQDIINFGYSDSINEFDSLDLTIQDRELTWLKYWNVLKGEKIVTNLLLHNWEKEKNVTLIPIGEFYVDKVVYSGIPNTVKISALSVDITTDIMDDKKNRVWENVYFDKIVKDIAKECNLKLFYDCKFNREYVRVEQRLESNFNFLKRLTQEIGIVVKLYNDRLILFEESVFEEKPSKLILTRNELKSYTFENDDTDTYAGCKITYTNRKGKKVEASFFTKQRSGYKRNTQRVLFINEDKAINEKDNVKVKAYLAKLAEKALREKNKSSIRASIEIMGREDLITVGDCIELLEVGFFSGKYMITKLDTDLKTYDLKLELQKVEEKRDENDGN